MIFRNIHAPAGQRAGTQNEIVGFDAGHIVSHVLYQDVTEGGHPVTAADVAANPYSQDIQFKK